MGIGVADEAGEMPLDAGAVVRPNTRQRPASLCSDGDLHAAPSSWYKP
jgi:hypothetical protein